MTAVLASTVHAAAVAAAASWMLAGAACAVVAYSRRGRVWAARRGR